MRRNVCVLGGGIGGLSAAHFVKHRARKALEPATVRVVEASPRFGGNIESVRCDTFLFETGPRSIRVTETSVATLKLIQHLDLEKHMIVGPALNGLTYHNGKVGPFEAHLGLGDVLRLAGRVLREPFVRKTTKEDESIYDWSMRRLGPYLTHYGIDPMISGIYAGDTKKLSMRSCLTKFWKWEQQHGSVIRGAMKSRREARDNLKKKESEGGPVNPLQQALAPFSNMPISPGGIFSFTNGIATLTDALARELSPDEKIVGKRVVGIKLRKSSAAVTLSDGSVLECDTLISALPNHIIAPLLMPNNARLAELLDQVKPTSLAVVNFGFKKPHKLPAAFGYLMPPSDKLDALGVVFDSSTFPVQNPGMTALTVMMGGEHNLSLVDLPEQEIAARAMQHLSYHIQEAPDVTNVTKWRNAIPQYTVGHHARIAEIEEILQSNFPNFHLAGSGLYGVGVNDTTLRAQDVANRIYGRKQQAKEAPAVAAPEAEQSAEAKS